MVVLEEVTEDYALDFKEKGNDAFRRGDWAKADQYFTEGMGLAEPPLKSTLLANRCQARLNAGQPGRALDDAAQALRFDRTNSKALYRKARCEMLLGRYVDAMASFRALASNGGALPAQFATLEQEIQRRQQQAKGDYDFVQLLEQPPKGDAAAYAGPVRATAVHGKGRGVVVTRDVSQGELLFVEPAFALGSDLEAAVSSKLRCCAQADAAAFGALCEGDGLDLPLPAFASALASDAREAERAPEDARSVDKLRVKRVLGANAHVCEQLDLRTGIVHQGEAGLWLFASLVNHSCVPNVTRTFFGDLLVCRACTDLKAGDEVLDAYVSVTQPLHERRAQLTRKYGFEPQDARQQLEAEALPESVAASLLAKYDAAACSSRRFEPVVQDVERVAEKTADALLVCGSLLCVFAGAALTARVKGADATKAYAKCCEIAERVAPFRLQHAGFAWDLVQQAVKHGVEVPACVRYCRHVFDLCYGKKAFDHLAQQVPALYQRLAERLPADAGPGPCPQLAAPGHVEPTALRPAKEAAPAVKAKAEVAPAPVKAKAVPAPVVQAEAASAEAPCLPHRIVVQDAVLQVEVDVPDGATSADLEVQVSGAVLRVQVGGARQDIALPEQVEAGGERVKFSSRKRRLTITLARL